jgi:hypothetical protein
MKHVGEGPDGRPEPAELEDAIRWFRSSVHEWSRRVPLGGWEPETAVRRSIAQPKRWAVIATTIATTLVILAGVPIYRNVERQHAAEQAWADALLLEQVDAGLSRPVPAPMEPLLGLVSGDIR